MTASPQDGPSRAAARLRALGLGRLIDELRTSYVRHGRPGGVVTLANPSQEERAGLERFLGRQTPPGSLRIKPALFDQHLRETGYACSLEDALRADAGGKLDTRPAARAREASRRAQVRKHLEAELDAIAGKVGGNGRRWLESGAHGAAWLLGRGDQAPSPDVILAVARGLEALPLEPPSRLVTHAQHVTGDAHAFDVDRPAGVLFLWALRDVFAERAGIGGASVTRAGAEDRRRLLQAAGLLPDTLSVTVYVFNLVDACDIDGKSDPLARAGAGRVLTLSLRQLDAWVSARAALEDVYVVENPSVLEDIADRFEDTRDHVPTVVCTSGWPNPADWKLLDLLVAGGAQRILYSGDFDLNGMAIAEAVRSRYPNRFQLWRFSPEDYEAALRWGGSEARPQDLDRLVEHAWALELVNTLRTQQRWAYQEGLTEELQADIQRRAYREGADPRVAG
jgi:uncharacterized protein (TIGR02679 family)